MSDHPTAGRRLLLGALVVFLSGGIGLLVRPSVVQAGGVEKCGWECKGLECKADPDYPNIRCEEEFPGEVCTNFECKPSVR